MSILCLYPCVLHTVQYVSMQDVQHCLGMQRLMHASTQGPQIQDLKKMVNEVIKLFFWLTESVCVCRWVCWVEQVRGRALCSPLCCVSPPLTAKSPLMASPGAPSRCTHGGRPSESCRRYVHDRRRAFQQDKWPRGLLVQIHTLLYKTRQLQLYFNWADIGSLALKKRCKRWLQSLILKVHTGVLWHHQTFLQFILLLWWDWKIVLWQAQDN